MKKCLTLLLLTVLLTAALPGCAAALTAGSIDIPAFSVEDKPYRNLIDEGVPVDEIVAVFQDVCQWEREGNVIRMGDLECSSVEFYTGDEAYEDVFFPMTLTDGVWSCTLPEGCEVVEEEAAFWCDGSGWFGGLRLDGSLDFLEPVYDAASGTRLYCYREDGMLLIYQEEYSISPEGWDAKMHRWYTNTYNPETGELYLQQVSDGGYTIVCYDVNGNFVYMEDWYEECCYIAGEGWYDSWSGRNPIAAPDGCEGYDGSTAKVSYPPHMPWLSGGSIATDTDLPAASVELPAVWEVEETYDNFADAGLPIGEIVECFEGLPNWKQIGSQISLGDMGCSDVTFYSGETIVHPGEDEDWEEWLCYEMALTDGIWRCILPEGSAVVEDRAYFHCRIGDVSVDLSLTGEVWELIFENVNMYLVDDGYIWCDYIARVEGAAACDYMDYYDAETGAYLGSEVSERWNHTDQAFYDADGDLVYASCFYGEYYRFIPGDGWREYYPDGPRVEPPDFMKSYTEDYFRCLMPCLKPSLADPRPVPAVWDAVLPDGLTAVESEAFLNAGIANLYIPDGVTSVATDAFSGCDLTYVRIPGSLLAFDQVPRANVIVVPEGSYMHEYLKEQYRTYQLEILYVLE